MMNHAVKKCGCDLGIGENVVPISKFEVRGNDNRFTLITFGDDLKEKFRAVGINRNIPPFIANEQIKFVELLHEKREFSFVFGFY